MGDALAKADDADAMRFHAGLPVTLGGEP